MLPGLVARIYRERRRLIFVAAMAFLAGFLFYLRSDKYVDGLHVAWITGAIYAGVVGVCAIFVCLFLPGMRFMIEAVAISRLFLSLVVLAIPELGQPLIDTPILMAFAVVFGGILISRVLHGKILRDRAKNWRDRLIPGFKRHPARIIANPWQVRFVGWMDDAVPVRV